ncbi:MAG TPA: MaoC family dehydratase [Burkholderiales bacterium]|nr:MaoC family dehydratase [Burkholderiales bacterium]
MSLGSLRELERRVGEEVGVSPWIEVSQERIDTFAKAIEDFQWIHVDPARAQGSPFGGTIAHGFLTLSLLSRLSEMTFSFSDRRMGVNYGLNRVRFTSPVPAGSRVRARFKLLRFEPLDGNGVQVTWDTVVEREGSDKPALVAEWLGRHYY